MHSEEIERILTEVSRGLARLKMLFFCLKKNLLLIWDMPKLIIIVRFVKTLQKWYMAQEKRPNKIAGIVSSLQNGGEKTVLITRLKPEAAAFFGHQSLLITMSFLR